MMMGLLYMEKVQGRRGSEGRQEEEMMEGRFLSAVRSCKAIENAKAHIIFSLAAAAAGLLPFPFMMRHYGIILTAAKAEESDY